MKHFLEFWRIKLLIEINFGISSMRFYLNIYIYVQVAEFRVDNRDSLPLHLTFKKQVMQNQCKQILRRSVDGDVDEK